MPLDGRLAHSMVQPWAAFASRGGKPITGSEFISFLSRLA
jgi:hypothetical protein